MTRDSERGSALVMSVITVATIGLAVTCCIVVGALTARVRSQRVVDRAALSAVNVLIGAVPGGACAVAEKIVASEGGQLVSCSVSNFEARVITRLSWGSFSWSVRAHAGLAESPT